MRQWLPLYEGDGYLHSPGDRRRQRYGSPGTLDSESDRAELRNKVQGRRAEVLRAWFPKAIVWGRDRMRHARMCEAERYLSQATDLTDLERRLEELTRKGICLRRC